MYAALHGVLSLRGPNARAADYVALLAKRSKKFRDLWEEHELREAAVPIGHHSVTPAMTPSALGTDHAPDRNFPQSAWRSLAC